MLLFFGALVNFAVFRANPRPWSRSAVRHQRAPVAFANTHHQPTHQQPSQCSSGRCCCCCSAATAPLLQLPHRCLPLPHGRFHSSATATAKILALCGTGCWNMRRRARRAGRVWMGTGTEEGACLWGRAGVVRGRGVRWACGGMNTTRLSALPPGVWCCVMALPCPYITVPQEE